MAVMSRYGDLTSDAGLVASPSPPAADRSRFVSRCRERGCSTWTFGDTRQEAEDRMTTHRGEFYTLLPTAHRLGE
jgi:hypothetical protein